MLGRYAVDNDTPRSRRELRAAQQRRDAQLRKDAAPVARFSRIFMVAIVAAVTVVAPLSGLVSPDLSIAAPTNDFTTTETLLSVVARASGLDDSDTGLNAVPAASRARIAEATQMGRCAAKDQSANGDAQAAPEKPAIYWPLYKGAYTYSSPWGMRMHPILGTRMMHEGADLTAPAYTPIYAVADGVVQEGGMTRDGGLIEIKHEYNGEVFYSRYRHMYADGIYVSAGQTVKAGQKIAGVGNTGRSTGAHLHIEILNPSKNSVEPLNWLRSHGAEFLNSGC